MWKEGLVVNLIDTGAVLKVNKELTPFTRSRDFFPETNFLTERKQMPLLMNAKGNQLNTNPMDFPRVSGLLTLTPVLPGYYTDHLGFFCRQELQVQRRIPLKFRLGSVDHMDYLEQKPNSGLVPMR